MNLIKSNLRAQSMKMSEAGTKKSASLYLLLGLQSALPHQRDEHVNPFVVSPFGRPSSAVTAPPCSTYLSKYVKIRPSVHFPRPTVFVLICNGRHGDANIGVSFHR